MIHHSDGVNRGPQQGRKKESHIENLLDTPITIHLKDICFNQHKNDFDPMSQSYLTICDPKDSTFLL